MFNVFQLFTIQLPSKFAYLKCFGVFLRYMRALQNSIFLGVRTDFVKTIHFTLTENVKRCFVIALICLNR